MTRRKPTIPATGPTPTATMRDPTEAERRSMDLAAKRQLERHPRFRFALTERAERVGNASEIIITLGPTHSDADGYSDHLRDTFGSAGRDFPRSMVNVLEPVLRQAGENHAPAERLNAALAMMGAIAPVDELEGAIGVQIASCHFASLSMLGKAMAFSEAGNAGAAADYVTMATKLSRTFTSQIEALAKLRGGGRQIIEHRHYNISAENAVVGDNTNAVFGGIQQGESTQNVDQPYATTGFADVANASRMSVSRQNPPRNRLPVACGQGQEAVPDARRKEPRRAVRTGKRPLPKRTPHPGTDAVAVNGPGARQARAEDAQ